jgi:hypothetical protein
MRIQTLLTLLGAASLSASALAAPAVAPDATASSAMPVEVVSGAQYKLRPIEFEGVQGVYNLSNGQILRVSSAQRKLYAELDGQGKSEIVPVAENTFVSREDAMTLVFDQIPFATDVRLTPARK